MTDIVERLRTDIGGSATEALMDEAAVEIERLQSDLDYMETKRNTVQATLFAALEENEALRAALETIANDMHVRDLRGTARRALEPKP